MDEVKCYLFIDIKCEELILLTKMCECDLFSVSHRLPL